jgi:hypothetical protein
MKTKIKTGCIKPGFPKTALAVFASFFVCAAPAQRLYDNHEGQQMVHYQVARNGGRFDSAAVNPKRDKVNNSQLCGMFSRSKVRYDYIKIIPLSKLGDVTPYMNYEPEGPKIRLKVYSNAPAGSLVEVQLGQRKAINAYPEGTHSQFQAYTKTSGEWEELEFTFSQVPKGSLTLAKDIDQVTLLFRPNSSQEYDFYFDDLTGPSSQHTAMKPVKRKGQK